MKTRRAVGLLFGLLVAAPSVFADEIRPALLEINERDGGWVEVTWKVPMRGNQVEDLTPVLPEFLEPLGAGSGQRVPGAWLEYRTYRNAGQTLTGATLRIDGLAALPTDVLIRVSLQDGTQHSAVLRSGNESFTIPEQATRVQLAVSYWQIGTIHILEGFDHLLFLLTLLLIVTGLWPLLKTVTAFTVAHSLTLALATLGIVNFPSAPTEAVISLSIMLLAVEAVRKSSGETTLSERFPWLVAFTFGLVHGLGFAGALSEIGVP
ncbi:MAG: HupE/UreJ family protein, partial [Chloroflexi bacterium]